MYLLCKKLHIPAKKYYICSFAFLCFCIHVLFTTSIAHGAATDGIPHKEIHIKFDASTPVLRLLGKQLVLVEGVKLPPNVQVLRDNWNRMLKLHSNSVFDPKNMPLPKSHQQQYKTLVERLPKMDPLTRLRGINGFFNNIPSRDDSKLYGTNEYWASPREFLQNRAGDCEDYAIAKFFALKYFKWPAKDLWVVFLYDHINDGMHAVLAAKHKQRVFILDNLSRPSYLLIPEQQYTRQVQPFAVFNDQGLWLAFSEKKTSDSVSTKSKANAVK